MARPLDPASKIADELQLKHRLSEEQPIAVIARALINRKNEVLLDVGACESSGAVLSQLGVSAAGLAMSNAASGLAQMALMPTGNPLTLSGLVAAWSIEDVVLSSGKVSQWNDRSGNGHHLTQSSSAAQWTLGNAGAVPPPGQNIGYDLAGLSVNYQSLTVVWIGTPPVAPINLNGTLMATNPVSTGGTIQYSTEPTLTHYNPTRYAGSLFCQTVNGLAVSHASDRTLVGSNGIFTTTTAPNSGTDTLTKFFVYEGGGYPWGNPTIACYVFSRGLSEQEISRIFAFHGVSQVGDTIINFAGDSLTIGSNASTLAQSWSGLASAQLQVTPKYSAQAGTTMVVAAGLNASMVNASFIPSRRNVYTLFLGTNDLAANNSEATLETNFANFCEARKSYDSHWLVVVCTILPRSSAFSGGQNSSGFESSRGTFNSWLRANYTKFADALIDFAGDSTIGDQADASNTTYYSDGVHLTNAGHLIASGIFVAGISPLLDGRPQSFSFAPLTGATLAIAYTSCDALLAITPAGTIAELTVPLPAAAMRAGQIIRISTTQTITALTLSAVEGSIINAATTLSANGYCGFQSDGTNWRRIQ